MVMAAENSGGGTPLIRVDHMRKYYPIKGGIITHTTGQVKAVDDVSFSIMEGETLGLVGESGCGKSTIGRALVGLEPPTAGSVFYRGRELSGLKKDEMRKIRTRLQMVFQDPYSSLNPRKHIYEILARPMLYHGISDRKTVLDDIVKILDMVGLQKNILGRYPHEFSGGQRQRIGIARALSLNPEFIVCDEPVSALDVSIQAQVLNLLMDLQDEFGLTLMFVTHDLSVVRHISDSICVMYLGQLVEKADTEDLFNRPLHPYTKALLSAIPSVDIHNPSKRILLKGEITSAINPKAGCRFVSRCPYATDRCKEPQKLAEVEPQHFVSCCRVNEINN